MGGAWWMLQVNLLNVIRTCYWPQSADNTQVLFLPNKWWHFILETNSFGDIFIKHVYVCHFLLQCLSARLGESSLVS